MKEGEVGQGAGLLGKKIQDQPPSPGPQPRSSWAHVTAPGFNKTIKNHLEGNLCL